MYRYNAFGWLHVVNKSNNIYIDVTHCQHELFDMSNPTAQHTQLIVISSIHQPMTKLAWNLCSLNQTTLVDLYFCRKSNEFQLISLFQVPVYSFTENHIYAEALFLIVKIWLPCYLTYEFSTVDCSSWPYTVRSKFRKLFKTMDYKMATISWLYSPLFCGLEYWCATRKLNSG